MYLVHLVFWFLAILLNVPGAALATGFSHAGIAKDAERYEAFISSNFGLAKGRPADLRVAGEKLIGSDPRAAARSFAAAAALERKDAENWLGLARALLAIRPEADKGSERFDLPVNASGAAYRAVERAATPQLKARALDVLGDALVRRSYWRPAIESFKSSLALAQSSDVQQKLDQLRTAHGFRMTDYKPDTESSTPRLCAQFSEMLKGGSAELSKFVSVDGKDPSGLSVEGKQLCIEGLKHGQRYELTLRAGLPSDVGETIEKNIDIAVYVPDRKPTIRFTGRSYVLPSRGQQGIPLVSVNAPAVAVEVYRIGDRNLAPAIQSGDLQRQLSRYDLEQIRDRSGERVYAGQMDVAVKSNEEVTAAFPVGEAIGTLKPGVYAMIARPADRKDDGGEDYATQWFIVSDLGLTAFSGADGVHAFVRSLSDAVPVAGASVKLIARNNEVLGTVKTDQRGYARFEGGLNRGEGGLQPAVLVAEQGSGEYAFLDLTAAAFDLSDRGVKGREAAGALDGYVYPERGVYRPGEAVHLTALVRDGAGRAATLPTTLVVWRPDGVEHRRIVLPDQGLGGRATTLELGDGAMTGTWRAKLHADPKADPIAQAAFLVEDFVPERMELSLEPPAGSLGPGKPVTLKASGRYLYGPPAADLALEGDLIVKPAARDLQGFAGYRFGQADEIINPVRKALESLPKTNAEGRAEIAVTLPEIPRTARPLEASLIMRLREPGGRTVERTLVIPVDLGLARIGIKPAFGTEGLKEDEPARFSVVMLDATSKQVPAKGIRWELKRLETSWVWFNREGRWSYDAVTVPRKVADGLLDLPADAPAAIEAKLGYGRYRLEVSSAGADGPASSYVFNAGWFTSEDNPDSPEQLDVAFDRPSYKPGDTAKLRIASKQGGKALVAVIGSGLHSLQEVEITKGGGEVPITVGADWGPGAYAAALLYRPMDEKAKRMPARGLGIKWLPLDQSDRTLKVALDLPSKVKPGTSLSVPVKLTGLAAGEEARVTIAAVDVGILNLTRYDTPAPEKWFHAQRRLGVELRDFYGRLIDGMRADRGKLRSGGDGPAGMSMQGSPPVEELVALYSGILSVDADGTAKASFALPEFNGSVRVMAVAWSKDKLGHADGTVIVRDAVALTVAAPRFLTLGDEARLDLGVHNIDAAQGRFNIALESQAATAPAAPITRTLDLATGARKSERVVLKPADVGQHKFLVRVAGPGGIEVKRPLTFEVMPPAGDIKRTTVSRIAPKGGRMTLSKDLLQDLIASRTRVNLSVGPAARLDVPGLLTQLDRYPYGCAEQTVSRALPLVYANAVAAEIGIAQDKELKARIAGAIDRVFEMQDASGAFGTWGPTSTDLWLTAYVTDFLTRAKEQGFSVNPKGFGQALDRLANFIAYAQDFQTGGEARAYALYVLARNGRAPAGELRYYADTRLDRFSTPLAKAQLGAALAMQGDKERSSTVFKAALAHFDKSAKESFARSDYGSSLRDGAALVTLASEARIATGETPRLVDVIAKAALARTHTSTQEQAWLLLAAHALADKARATSVSINGTSVKGSQHRSIAAAELARGDITITNDGDEPVDAVVSVIGSSLTAEPAVSRGFRIERSYYALDGRKVDIKSADGGTAQLRQNDRLVAVVKIESPEAGGRLLLVDRLPAGLEIENPRLVDGGDIKTLDWLKPSVRPEHTEFLDDRFIAAFNFFGSNTRQGGERNGEDDEASGEGAAPAPKQIGPTTSATVAYIVRAVTPGTFIHPAATIEDMYRPERHARSASGRLTVTPGD